jgi:hypothetical protein
VRAVAPAWVVAALALACCGGEREFSAEEFIEAANAHDAGLVLADPLASTREGVEVYELQFEGGGPAAAGAGAIDAHGGGTLTITEDAEAGAAEYERCEAAVTLLCFRAANVALYFEGALAPSDLARVERAIRALGEEG